MEEDASVIQQIEYNAHYHGYVERQKEIVSRSESVEKVVIPEKLITPRLVVFRMRLYRSLVIFDQLLWGKPHAFPVLLQWLFR